MGEHSSRRQARAGAARLFQKRAAIVEGRFRRDAFSAHARAVAQ